MNIMWNCCGPTSDSNTFRMYLILSEDTMVHTLSESMSQLSRKFDRYFTILSSWVSSSKKIGTQRSPEVKWGCSPPETMAYEV